MPQRKKPPVKNHQYWLRWLYASPRRVKQVLLLGVDVLAVPAIVILALNIRLAEVTLPNQQVLAYLPVFAVMAGLCLALMGVYRAVVRAFDEHFLMSALAAALLWVATIWIGMALGLFPWLPRSVPLMAGFLLLIHLWLSRFVIRAGFSQLLERAEIHESLVIYGAGSAGRQLMAAALASGQYRCVAFLDDDPELIGTIVAGLPVYSGSRAAMVVQRFGVQHAMIAMPSVTRARRRDIVSMLDQLGLRVLVLPGLDQIISGKVSLRDVREVEIEDLLGRDAMPPDIALFRHHLADRVVMVTGAAGSIGSELCRQILTAQPRVLVLFDHSEFGLYQIDAELRLHFPQAVILPVLGNVLDEVRLLRLMRHHEVETVYHAAAYKHVPLVEANPFEGVRNNSLGTYSAARAAREAGVETFVLVSTDKAVRPTNVMGASKRLAEMALQALAKEPIQPGQLGTCFSMVRFGNVLGSSGSVVPLFRKQIAEGGPITLTHPDVTRYFMTIPEAAQLVIQAGGMAKGGEVFLLEMGEPVRILDLAHQMIRLSGLTLRSQDQPDGDIAIRFTGLRPGEKLYEELLISSENACETHHPLIYQAHEPALSMDRIKQLFAEIERLAIDRDARGLKRLLMFNVAGYKPDFGAKDLSADCHDRHEQHDSIAAFRAALAEPIDSLGE